MKFFFTFAVSILLLGSASAAPGQAPRREEIPPSLARLTAQAKSSRTWPELRRYARSRRTARDRALAYFVLGYREYQSGKYTAAEKDLAAAVPVNLSLADLVQYYCAAAAYKSGYPETVAKLLSGFSARFPHSFVRYLALELLARGYLETGQPKSAFSALQREPEVLERPALALLMAQAYRDDGKLQSAARVYQDVYNAFPVAPEARRAAAALQKLKASLGPNFPSVSDEIATARVEKLYSAAQYSKALNGYNELLKDRQGSSWAWRWNLGRAQCLVRLGRGDEALETLVASVAPTPEMDAERLAILVEAYVQADTQTAAVQALDRLRSRHLKSSWHAQALETLAKYQMGKGNRKQAGLYYRTLAELFPQKPLGAEASWRFAWINYLAGNSVQSRSLFVDYIKNYPQSAHVPAALYFLGRLEQQGHPSTARALYALVTKRFVHGYYALEAARRLRTLPRASASKARWDPDLSVTKLAATIPPTEPLGVQLCQRPTASASLRSFEMLQALHLNKLAEQDLRARIARQPSAVPLRLALSRFAAREGRSDLALYSAKKIVPNYYSQPFSEIPRFFWGFLYPTAYRSLVRRRAALNRLDPYLVMALIRRESAFNPRATSPSNARGLMQILPTTATRSRRYRSTVARRLYDPAYNVRFGCAYLRQLLKRFHGNLAQALAAYNAGPNRVSQWLSQYSFRDPEQFLESIPLDGTRIYVERVLADRAMYRQLMAGSVKFADCSSRRRSPAR